jgi:hypothetical protein
MLALLMTGARLALHNDPESDDEQHADPTSPSGGMHPLELDEVALHNDHADATSASSAGAKPGARWVKWAERSAAHLQKKVEAVVQSATGAGPTQRESAPRDEVRCARRPRCAPRRCPSLARARAPRRAALTAGRAARAAARARRCPSTGG